jgi:hemoglobin
MDKKTPTLYEWAGGMEPITRLIATFYDHAVQDDLLGSYFTHMPKAHVGLVAEWFAEIMGGPKTYSERYGTMTAHPHMIQMHKDLAISEDARRRWALLMSQSADEEKLPADPEFRSAFMAYVEWGTRMAMMFSQKGSVLPTESPMPEWSWGETPPYLPHS